MDSDRTMVQERCLPVVLWEDVLAAAQRTPLAALFDFDIAPYITRPVEPVDGRVAT